MQGMDYVYKSYVYIHYNKWELLFDKIKNEHNIDFSLKENMNYSQIIINDIIYHFNSRLHCVY